MPSVKRNTVTGATKVAAGKLYLDLVDVPLPRSRGWSYVVSLCGNELFRAKSYADLLRPHAVTSEVDFTPGGHALLIRGKKADARAWQVEVEAMAPDGQGFTDIRTVIMRDVFRPESGTRAAVKAGARTFSIERTAGLVESIRGRRGRIRATDVKPGMTLPAGSVLVTGPGSSVVVQDATARNAAKRMIRALSVVRLGGVQASSAVARRPDIIFNRGKALGGRPTCGHCVQCSVRG